MCVSSHKIRLTFSAASVRCYWESPLQLPDIDAFHALSVYASTGIHFLHGPDLSRGLAAEMF